MGGFVKSLKVVTPVKTGVQNYLKKLGSRFRGNDKKNKFLLVTSPLILNLDKE